MTDAHYKRIQSRIQREMKGSFDSSGWFASAVAFFSVGATILVTIEATNITEAAKKGNLELTAWVCLLGMIICFAIHFSKRKEADVRADDIIAEMDTYNIEVAQHDARVSRGDAGAPASLPLAL